MMLVSLTLNMIHCLSAVAVLILAAVNANQHDAQQEQLSTVHHSTITNESGIRHLAREKRDKTWDIQNSLIAGES